MDISTLHELPTRREVADFLRVHDSTVDRLVAEGKLPAVKFGATVRIPRDGVERFIASHITSEPLAARTRKASRASSRKRKGHPKRP
jgi:excisionase family DNA binding protein